MNFELIIGILFICSFVYKLCMIMLGIERLYEDQHSNIYDIYEHV